MSKKSVSLKPKCYKLHFSECTMFTISTVGRSGIEQSETNNQSSRVDYSFIVISRWKWKAQCHNSSMSLEKEREVKTLLPSTVCSTAECSESHPTQKANLRSHVNGPNRSIEAGWSFIHRRLKVTMGGLVPCILQESWQVRVETLLPSIVSTASLQNVHHYRWSRLIRDLWWRGSIDDRSG